MRYAGFNIVKFGGNVFVRGKVSPIGEVRLNYFHDAWSDVGYRHFMEEGCMPRLIERFGNVKRDDGGLLFSILGSREMVGEANKLEGRIVICTEAELLVV